MGTSPGLGKTYLLRKIFSKQDFPSEYAEAVKAVKFLVLEFNRDACIDAKDFKEYFRSRPKLFALSRLFFVNFSVQSRLTWTRFLRKTVVPLILADLDVELEELMEQQFKTFKGESRCVILVDEIMKTEELGVDFADGVRSNVCMWMERGRCNAVLFSSLDAKFMRKERTASGRNVYAVTTLPLLNFTDSVSFLNDGIKAAFIDGGGNSINDRYTVIRQLALASGGHPRSIEYIINRCYDPTDSVKTRELKEVIDYAAGILCEMYDEKNCVQLLYNVLLGETVNGEDLLVGSDPTSELYRSFVMRGVLIDSFKLNNPRFIPTVPEMYLHRWINQGQLDDKIRRFLWQILKTRYEYTSVKFEIIHSSWEQLMRHVRQGNPKYAKIRLNDLYCIKLRNGAAPAASCLVDGRSILTEIKYVKGSNIILQPNTIYNPEDDQNKGWDRLIVFEAYEASSGSNTRQRYLLPLLIQNKLSKDASKSTLAVGDVKKANEHCKKFMESRITFDSDFSPIPMVGDNFVLLFVAKCDKYENVCTKSPSNVMFSFEENLEKLYGPTLKGFVST